VVKEGIGKIALNSIFGAFLRQLQKHAQHPVLVTDIRGMVVDFANPIPEEGFPQRFAVEVQEGRKKKIILLGFHLATKTPRTVSTETGDVRVFENQRHVRLPSYRRF